MNLLEKAQSVKTTQNYAKVITNEEIELALAFLNGEINDRQCSYAFGYKTTYVAPARSKLMTILRNACIQGKVELVLTGK